MGVKDIEPMSVEQAENPAGECLLHHRTGELTRPPEEEYFERVRRLYGYELVGIIELGDVWDEADGKEGRDKQSEGGENDHDAE